MCCPQAGSWLCPDLITHHAENWGCVCVCVGGHDRCNRTILQDSAPRTQALLSSCPVYEGSH